VNSNEECPGREYSMEESEPTRTDIDKARHTEGFPIAKDEDIIVLLCPPYYTAYPNPFIEGFGKGSLKQV
jgi:hypothetical protein